jgi:inorganic pyrophosphatase
MEEAAPTLEEGPNGTFESGGAEEICRKPRVTEVLSAADSRPLTERSRPTGRSRCADVRPPVSLASPSSPTVPAMPRLSAAFAPSSAALPTRAVSALVGRGARGRPAAPVVPRAGRSAGTARMHHDVSTAAAAYSREVKGVERTREFRLFYSADGKPVSPWHDVPVYRDPANTQVVNFVNEIPKGTQAKMEIATDEPLTPIKQDIKKGALREYKWGPSLVNYGAIPQTWEDPGSVHEGIDVGGDNDPVDLADCSNRVADFGAIYPVKVLGTLAMIDEGEIDFKVLGIATADPLSEQMDDIDDLERLMPGKVDSIREWFRMYKTAEGKGENSYAFDGKAMDAAYTMKVIADTHQSWAALRSGAIANDDDLWLGGK